VAKNITKLKHRFPLRQLKSLFKWLSHQWPFLILFIFVSVISFLNYESGTFLTGWDNLHTEFNPLLDLKRSLFSVWQEYRGVGLLSGMAHAADLPRTLLVLLLTSFIPTDLVRYLITFSTLLIGSLGVYFFLDHILLRNRLDSRTVQTASLLGGLYYILNLSTLQTYFIPFETFTWFFAFFPWIFGSFILYLSQPSLSRLLKIFLLLLLSSPAFFVETMFIVLILCLSPLLIEHLSSHKNKIKPILHSLTLILTALISQSFWLLPIIFFVITQGHLVAGARNNLLSTPEIYERNLQFANLPDALTLKGYLFNYLDLGANNQYDYVLSVWKYHLSDPIISALGFVIFFISAIGFYYLIKRRFKWGVSILGLSVFCLFFLLGGGLLINQKIPFIGELFRSPFTKFSIPLSFCYSILFSVGTIFLLDLFSYLHSRLTFYITTFTVILFLFLYMSPVFSGNLISPYLRREIPPEYFQTFDFFKDQSPSTRIATFPQYTHWNWSFYDWGYRGSGFLWYGLPQALLDRSFDVWSKESQNYYEEIISALFSEDWGRFDSLIQKYSVNWLLIDHHVISPEKNIDLKTAELENHLTQSPLYSLSKNFNDTIYIFESKVKDSTTSFLSVTPKSVSITPFSPPNLRPNTSLNLTSNSIIFPPTTLSDSKGFTLNLPSLSETESLIPVSVSYQKAYGILNLKLEPIVPKVTLNDKNIFPKPTPTYVSIPVDRNVESLILKLNQDYFELQLPAEITEFVGYYPIAETYLPSKKPVMVSLYSGTPQSGFNITSDLKIATPVQCFTSKPNRKIEKIITGDTITLLGTDAVACLSTRLPFSGTSGVYSVDFSYSSPTLTPGNISITDLNLGAQNSSQPLETAVKPRHTRLFAEGETNPQQLNLILEANETKSIQEISYSNINLYFHPLIFSTNTSLIHIPSKKITLTENSNQLSLTVPLTDSGYDTIQTPDHNQLLPASVIAPASTSPAIPTTPPVIPAKAGIYTNSTDFSPTNSGRNCDQFNSGPVKKTITQDGFKYESQNSIECDYLNLRHLPHGLNYLISADYRYQTGLPMTLCLENHSTRRCDVYERLIKSDQIQTLIQPIRNDAENPGFTLHLFNQSVGKRKTTNLLKQISLHPIPLNFIQNISFSSPAIPIIADRPKPTASLSSTHPAEYIYTASASSFVIPGLTSNPYGDTLLNLYQSKSPYWIALKVDSSFLKSSLLSQTIRLPFLYFTNPKLQKYDTGTNWYNSWNLPEGEHSIVIFYAPQYLEFLGLLFIIITTIVFLISSLSFLHHPLSFLRRREST